MGVDTSCLVVGKHLEEADPEIKRARSVVLLEYIFTTFNMLIGPKDLA